MFIMCNTKITKSTRLIRLMDALSDDRTKPLDALILPIPTS